MIIATAGHVDHGKTSLVHALTGVDTDRLKEEKQRGLTIDLGFAYMDAETGGRLGFVDVPGHIRFINNMLAGVSAIDFALLVIAADDGVMPQTIEHLDVLQLLGIKAGAIALTKIDRCEPSRVDEVTREIGELVSSTFLSDAEIYPVSAITGEGVETLKIALDITADEITRQSDEGLFRLAIDRRFSVHGSGIVVTGSVFAGSIDVGDNLMLMPQGIEVRVRGLHTQNQEATSAAAGDRSAVNITGARLDIEDIHRGNWLTENPGEATARLDVRLDVLGSERRPLSHWTPVHVHAAANHVTGRIAVLEQAKIEPGQSGLTQLVLDEPINLCTGDRVVVRDQAALRTIGGGVVLDPWSPKRGRARPERLDMLKLIDPRSAGVTLQAMVQHRNTGVNTSRFACQFNLTGQQLTEIADQLDMVRLAEDRIISTNHFAENVKFLRQMIDDWHKKNPGKPGLPLNQISAMIRAWPPALLDKAVGALLDEDELVREGNLLKRPGHGVNLNAREQATFEKVMPLLQTDATKPPVLHDLAKTLDTDPKSLEKVLNQVAKAGQLIKPVKNRYFLPEGFAELKQHLFDAADDKGQFTVQQYRDASGIGRNLSIEILEYFDRQGLTRRLGDVREIIE